MARVRRSGSPVGAAGGIIVGVAIAVGIVIAVGVVVIIISVRNSARIGELLCFRGWVFLFLLFGFAFFLFLLLDFFELLI